MKRENLENSYFSLTSEIQISTLLQVTELHFDFPHYLGIFFPHSPIFMYRRLATKHTLISDFLFIIAIITLNSILCVCCNGCELVSQCHISRRNASTAPWHLIFMAVVIFYFSSNGWHILDKFQSEETCFSSTFYVSSSPCDEVVTAVSVINDLATCRIQPTETDYRFDVLEAIFLWEWNIHQKPLRESIRISDSFCIKDKNLSFCSSVRMMSWFSVKLSDFIFYSQQNLIQTEISE